jgi:hypothetical protein
VTVRTDVTVEFGTSPKVIEVLAPSTEIIMQDVVDTLRKQEDSFQGMTFKKLLGASGKDDLGGGVQVGITAALQNIKLAFEGRTATAQTGTVTDSPSNPLMGRQTMEDTSATFEDNNVARGSLVINFTDQSVAEVIRVNSQIELQTKTLVNGIANTYGIGDVYHIYNVIQVSAIGGNLVAVDDAQSTIPAILPTAFTQVVVTGSSSATLLKQKLNRHFT